MFRGPSQCPGERGGKHRGAGGRGKGGTGHAEAAQQSAFGWPMNACRMES